MIESVDHHRPFVEFDDAEIAEFDRAFFREAFELAAGMRGKQAKYGHRCVEGLPGLLRSVEQAAALNDFDRAEEALKQLVATCARNARLARLLKGTQRRG